MYINIFCKKRDLKKMGLPGFEPGSSGFLLRSRITSPTQTRKDGPSYPIAPYGVNKDIFVLFIKFFTKIDF